MQKKIVRSNKRQELSQKGEVADEESDDIEKVLNLPLKTVAELKKFDLLLKNDANTRNKYVCINKILKIVIRSKLCISNALKIYL